MANNFLATANRVAAHLGKAPKDFTKEDIIRVVQDFDIRMVNLMYPGGDGRLKTLNFMLNSADYLNTTRSPVVSAWTAARSSPPSRQPAATST